MSDYYPRTIIGTSRPGTFSKTTPLGDGPRPEAIVAESKRAIGLLREGYQALPDRPVRAMKRFFASATVSGNLIVNINIHKIDLPEGFTAKINHLHDKAVAGMGKAAKILITKRMLKGSKTSLGFSNFSDKIYS